MARVPARIAPRESPLQTLRRATPARRLYPWLLPSDLNFGQSFLLEFDDPLGQRCIVQRRGEGLALGQHPCEELLDGIALAPVLDARWDQEPGEAGNRVRVRAGGVSDRHAEVGRHVARG